MFIYFYLLEFANHLILAPILSDFASKYAINPDIISLSKTNPKLYKEILKDIRFFLLFGLIKLAISSLILVISLSSIIHATHEAYTYKVLTLKDIFLNFKMKWKKPFVTSIHLVFLTFAFVALFVFVLGFVSVITEGPVLSILEGGLLIFGAFFCVYFSVVWILSLVVSILEENSSGMKAIERARDVMKGKKKLQGFLLMVILIFASVAISESLALLEKNTTKSRFTWMVISIPNTWLFCLKKLFLFIVFTLFYHECKKGHSVEDKTCGYAPISGAEV